VEGARVLGELRYSRQDEEEADREGVRLLAAAGVDPAGMIAFFETLERKHGSASVLPPYLSTHPTLEKRIERLRSFTPPLPAVTTRLLPGRDWRQVRSLCQATGPLAR
jgi:predicted Zn-dependent protease